MSNSIENSINKETIKNKEGLKINENKERNKNNIDIQNISTNISVVSLESNKKQRKDKNGVDIKKSFSTDIVMIDVESYKEYNRNNKSIFFEALSDLPQACTSCIII